MKTPLPGQTILLPSPVLIVGTYGADGQPNIMNAAWGGIACSTPPCISVSVRPATLTYHNIKHTRAFTINIPSQDHVWEADFVGMVSGREHNKFDETGLTPARSVLVDAPIVEEFPYTLECSLVREVELGSHTMFVGQIVGMIADDQILNERQVPDIEKVRPILWGSFGNMAYFGVGDRLADAFSVGRELRRS